MRNHRPHGSAVLAWEADILKVRALEMVLILFYVQDLKEFILHSIEGTHKIRSRLGIPTSTDAVVGSTGGNAGTREGKKLDRARALLVDEGVITQDESDELFKLMDYRNSIGHAVHELTGDVGKYAHLGKADPKTNEPITLYDYTAAKRAKALSEKIQEGMARSFVLTVNLGGLQFESAEKTYIAEVKRLKKKINKAIEKANQLIAETNRVIRNIPDSVKASAEPRHPRHTRHNGSLTPAGRHCAYALFTAGATVLAVAYMMRISLRSAKLAFRNWDAART